MVPSPLRVWSKRSTGRRRMYLVKAWIGFKVIAEEEFNFEYARNPISGPELATTEWVKISPWNLLGQGFYNSNHFFDYVKDKK